MAVKTYCSRVVSYLKKGPPGPQGNTGRMAVPYGTYGTPYEGATSPLTYVCTDRVAPMVYYKASGATTGYYYVMVRNTTWVYGTNTDPQTDYVNNSPSGTNTWARLQTVDYFFTKLLMADFGKIASAIFYGNLMFSQQGVVNGAASSNYSSLRTLSNGDVDESAASYFKPNFWVNFLNGKLKARSADIEGKVTCSEGTIGGFTIGANYIGTIGTATGNYARLMGGQLRLDVRVNSADATSVRSARYNTITLDADGGTGGFINVSANKSNNDVAGLSLSTPGTYGILCYNGIFGGLRPQTRSITTNPATLDTLDFHVRTALTGTINLPSSPVNGQTFFIYHENTNTVTIKSSTTNIYDMYNGTTVSQYQSTVKELLIVTYFSSASKWVCTPLHA